MAFPSPGIYHGVTEREYHAAKLCSKSNLWRFAASPYEWKHGPPVKVTDAMRFGSMVDCLVTGPESFDRDFALSPHAEFRTTEAKAWRAAQEAAGLTVMKAPEVDEAKAAADAIRNHPIAGGILEGAQFQVSVVADYPADAGPVRIKGRLDVVPVGLYADSIADIKTINDIRKVRKTIGERGYYVQLPLYRKLYNTLTGQERRRCILVFVESEPPYEVRVVELDADAIATGIRWYGKHLERWAKCHAENHFPSPYEDSIETIGLSKWDRDDDEDASA